MINGYDKYFIFFLRCFLLFIIVFVNIMIFIICRRNKVVKRIYSMVILFKYLEIIFIIFVVKICLKLKYNWFVFY